MKTNKRQSITLTEILGAISKTSVLYPVRSPFKTHTLQWKLLYWTKSAKKGAFHLSYLPVRVGSRLFGIIGCPAPGGYKKKKVIWRNSKCTETFSLSLIIYNYNKK